MVSSSSSLALAFVLAISSSSLAQYKASSGGLTVNAPQTNPTTCDPATVSYTYTGNSSWPVTIALTNALIDQSPLPASDSRPIFKNIQLGLPSTGSTPASVNWTLVDVPAGYYVILAEASPPVTYENNATSQPASAEASSDRFQVVNGTSTACLFPGQVAAPPAPNHTGAIVGGVIGGLALLLLLLLAACCLRKRNKNKKMSRKERITGAIPIEDQKSTTSHHKAEKLGAAGLGAGMLADPFTNDSKTQATSTAYDEGSTRAGSTHTLEDSHHFMGEPVALGGAAAATHPTHDDPFADPRFTGDFGPSQRSSTLDPEHDQIDEVLARPAGLTAGNGSGSVSSFKNTRKPAPEYDGTDTETGASMHTAQDNEPQQHYLVPDAPVRF